MKKPRLVIFFTLFLSETYLALVLKGTQYTVLSGHHLPGLHEQVNAYQERIFLFAHHCSPFVMRINSAHVTPSNDYRDSHC